MSPRCVDQYASTASSATSCGAAAPPGAAADAGGGVGSLFLGSSYAAYSSEPCLCQCAHVLKAERVERLAPPRRSAARRSAGRVGELHGRHVTVHRVRNVLCQRVYEVARVHLETQLSILAAHANELRQRADAPY